MELNRTNVVDFIAQRIDDAISAGIKPDSIVMGHDIKSLILKADVPDNFIPGIRTFQGLKVLCSYRFKGKVQAFEEGTISDPTWIERL